MSLRHRGLFDFTSGFGPEESFQRILHQEEPLPMSHFSTFWTAALLLTYASASYGAEWNTYRSDAANAWAELRQLSSKISFSITESAATDDKLLQEVRRVNGAVDGSQFYLHRTEGATEKIGVVGKHCAFMIGRRDETEDWEIVRYGPNRQTVLDNLDAQINAIRCPPLTPASKATVEELLAAEGLREVTAEEIGDAENRRVRLTVAFPDQPVIIRGQPIEAKQMIYEFDPAMYWVVTGFELLSDHFHGKDSVEYTVDKDNRPVLQKVVSHNTWLKTGTTQHVEKLYTKYEYACDPSLFQPENYGLPPLLLASAHSFRRFSLLLLGVTIVIAALLFRKRVAKNGSLSSGQ